MTVEIEARDRDHPQAEAIAVCGWWGVITMGLLLPVAWIWAYTKPGAVSGPPAKAPGSGNARAVNESDAQGVSS
jgi:hypothetical protein